MRRFAPAAAAAFLLVLLAVPAAQAAPTASDNAGYQLLGRVFPDPLAGCTTSPCSPNAKGNVAASQFIQYPEFVSALKYMNQRSDWRRYLEVLPLDGKEGDGAGTNEIAAFPGNNIGEFEFTPKEAYQSAGLPTTDLTRKKSDLFMLRVTDENVPDAGKKRYVLSLSIHGIERAGLEGGTRAMEDLVTAQTTGLAAQRILPAGVKDAGATPTFDDVLKKSIVYFIYPNPDVWRRGSVTEGGIFFQRYNGNGVDLNRDWPDIGFAFRPYSGLSEPESRAFAGVLSQIRDTKAPFSAGDDLHGQPLADALSFTLLPHGSHDFGKDVRIRESAKTIHRASEKALAWSPIVQPNDAPPQPGGLPTCAPEAPLGPPCAKIYGQTWGTVYDTINYTTTGALGDWFDSSVGLRSDGIDNEMSYSHLDKNILFDPHTEQLHVDGNKTLIYAHLAEQLTPLTGSFDPAGKPGYVPNLRVKRTAKSFTPAPPPGTVAQQDIDDQTVTPDPAAGTSTFPFMVKRGPQPSGPDIFNGGMRIDITNLNAQGIGGAVATLAVQCRNCDDHPGVEPDADGWITVQEDYNQSPIYLQAGLTAAVNRPQAFNAQGQPVEWRAVVSPAVAAKMDVDFTQGPASSDGGTSGDPPPELRGYDVANTDFIAALNPFIADAGKKFDAVSPPAVIAAAPGAGPLTGLSSLVLADDPLPGYTGPYAGEPSPPSGPAVPSAPKNFNSAATVPWAGSGAPGTFTDHPFTIAADERNASMKVGITWTTGANDFDLTVYRKVGADLVEAGSSAGGPPGTSEEVDVPNPAPGDYVARVTNFAAADSTYAGTVTFTAGGAGPPPSGTGAYTPAEKDAYFASLKSWVQGGGTLVLTDGALRSLRELTPIAAGAVARQTVYAGQVTFATANGTNTDSDPLAANIGQDGARFNAGHRRQTFEPTPVGFAIQNATGAGASNARQYDIDRPKFEALTGERAAGMSVDSGDRDAAPVYSRVALGEIPLGAGRIRVIGALLPQPETGFDHPLGLEPHAVTYTGYIVFCNLVGAACTPRAADSGTPGGSSPAGTNPAGSVQSPAPAAGTTPACRDRIAPVTRITRGSLRASRRSVAFAGRTSDRGCGARGAGRVGRVLVAVYRPVIGGCRYLQANGRLSARRRCNRPLVLPARGTTSWRFSKRVVLPRGPYGVWAFGIDASPGRNQERGGLRARASSFRLR
ncbi:MAG: hypothetical protein ACR2NH_02795 [Solirubrobacteraceae bacterium]